ncbi:hypothetical protein BHM03_00026643, partial [Ensete ventricosum]
SSGSLGNQSGPESSSSGIMARADAKALQALEAMTSHHDFDSTALGWDFGVEWLAHPVSNVPPNLSDEGMNLIRQLKGVLSASRAIRSLIEEWLVKASLSPASRGMPYLFSYEFHCLISQLMIGFEEMVSMTMMHGNPRTGGGCPGFSIATSASTAANPWDAGLAKRGSFGQYIRGTLIPRLASDLYTLPSEVLMDRATKAMELVITSLDSKVNLLCYELQDLKEGGDPNTVAATEVRAYEA